MNQIGNENGSDKSGAPSGGPAGSDWDAVARGWEKWRETMESGTATVTERLLEMTEIRPGWRVLDLACGVGQPALTAARRVGPRGRVVAVDHAEAMLALAKRQAEMLGLDNVQFVCGDAGTLTGVHGRFDAVLCRWGLMFLPDLPRALERILQTLEPGRRFAASVWSAPERVPSIDLPFEVANEVLGTPRMRVGSPGPFQLADGEALRRGFAEAGFRQVFTEFLPIVSEAPSAAAYVELSRDLNAPLAALLAQRTEPQRARFWEALRVAAGDYALPDGRVRFWNETVCITGRR